MMPLEYVLQFRFLYYILYWITILTSFLYLVDFHVLHYCVNVLDSDMVSTEGMSDNLFKTGNRKKLTSTN